MGFRLLLLNTEVPTSQAFKQAVPQIEAELVTLGDTQLAARVIRDERFDCVFVSTGIPGLSRQEFASMVRRSKFNGSAPVIFLTGYRDPEPQEGKAWEGVLLLPKPSSSREILPFLKELRRKLVAERRRGRRLSFRTAVNCVRGTRRFRATSIDLSNLGILLEGSPGLERGDDFEVYFPLTSDAPPFRARVRVVRIDRAGRLGLTFQNLGSSHRERLRQFLDRYLGPAR